MEAGLNKIHTALALLSKGEVKKLKKRRFLSFPVDIVNYLSCS